MGERARIGIEREDGTVESVYLHWGHPEWTVSRLLDHYSSVDTIEGLLILGGLRTLGDSPASSVPLGRDRGDYDPPEMYESAEAYLNDAGQTAVWHYLYRHGEWCYAEGGYSIRVDALKRALKGPF